MSRILIPRAAGSKVVASTDFESYFGDILSDYVVTGFCLAAQCPNILAADIAIGRGRQCGLFVNNSTSCAVTCLAACDTTFVYIQLNRDCMCRPCNFTFATNLTGCAPCEAQVIGSVTTNCATVTSVDNTLKNQCIGASLAPTGSITMFGGTIATVPGGWLLADGSCRSKVTCVRLFNVIGSQFGCCGCCFTLPDLRSTFARGAVACMEPGTTGGADTHTLTTAEMPAHTHLFNPVVNNIGCVGACRNTSGQCKTEPTTSTGCGCAHNNMPSFLEFLYIIKN